VHGAARGSQPLTRLAPVLLLLVSCAPTTGTGASWVSTPRGTRVYLPDWVEDPAAVLAFIDSEPPEIDPTLPPLPPLFGAPPGYAVIIKPGPYMYNGRIVNGQVDRVTRTVVVAWAWQPGQVAANNYLPALGHEYAHVWYEGYYPGTGANANH
jgi:hypothetical protein